MERKLRRNLTKVILYLSKHDPTQIQQLRQDPRLQPFWDKSPIFYNQHTWSPINWSINHKILKILPKEFFENPTLWFESLANIERGNRLETQVYRYQTLEVDTLDELTTKPYDVSKVKQFQKLIIKRIEQDEPNEINRAKTAYQNKIPTAKVWGEFWHWGNHYTIFQKLEAISIHNILEKFQSWFTELSALKYPGSWTKRIYKSSIPLNILKLILKIYKKYSVYFEQDELILMLHNHIAEKLNPSWQEREDDPLYGWNRLRRDYIIPTHSAQELLKQLGFNTIEEYYISLLGVELWNRTQQQIHSKTRDINFMLEVKDALRQAEAKFNHDSQRTQFEELSRKVLFKQIFGFDLLKEKDKLLKLTQKTGILHKDFHNRNLLTPWNFKTNKPRNTKPRLYLIDWEEN